MSNQIKIITVTITAVIAMVGIFFGINYISKTYIRVGNQGVTESKDVLFGLNLLKSGLQGDIEGGINVLLLGVSGQNYISGDLTDTIIFANVGLTNKKISLISIPRDLWVKTNDGSNKKINELYKLSGGTKKPTVEYIGQIKQKVTEITGQEIQYTAVIDLDGIKNIVDFIGGVKTEEGFKNGEQALFYIRDRSRAGSDFDRMKRQQKLIVAIINKVLEQQDTLLKDQDNALKLFELLETNISTNVSILEIFTLFNALKDTDIAQNINLHTITTNNLLKEEYRNINNQDIYILYPRAGEEDYSEIRDLINEIVN